MPIAAVALTALAIAMPSHSPPCATAGVGAVLDGLNAARAGQGVGPLHLSSRLGAAACEHSTDMVSHGYFAHRSADGGSFVSRIASTGWLRGRRGWALGEDLGWGTGDLGTPQGIVNAWMASPPHRAILLDARYSVVGIGIAAGTPSAGADGFTYTADFSS